MDVSQQLERSRVQCASQKVMSVNRWLAEFRVVAAPVLGEGEMGLLLVR